jgi:hypothetical protein
LQFDVVRDEGIGRRRSQGPRKSAVESNRRFAMSAVKSLSSAFLLLAILTPIASASTYRSRADRRLIYWNPEGTVRTQEVRAPRASVIAGSAAPAPAYSSPETNNLPALLTNWASVPQLTSNSIPAVPISAPAPTPPAPIVPTPTPAPAYSADAYINFGAGPYAESSLLTTGGAQPWYDSSVVQALYHGIPDSQQRADFTNTVLQRIEQTYHQSGVPVQLTTDPTVSAAHSISVVSNTSYSANPGAIGITDMGNSGFSFIDKLTYANSIDQLEWAIAHNVAHELMTTTKPALTSMRPARRGRC